MLEGGQTVVVWCWERVALYGSERVPSAGSWRHSPSLKVDDKEGTRLGYN